MPAKTGSRNGLSYGWALGENNWNTGMDGNLTFIDRFGIHLSFKSFLNTPPGSPAAGDCHVIDTVPTGVWVGKAGQVAVYDDGAWRYGVPRTGWRAYCEADERPYVYDGGWAPTASEWTAATVDQAEAEAGTATTRRAWTAQSVRQAIAAWWNSVTNIDGKNIGATTPGTARFTTLTTTGNVGIGLASPGTKLHVGSPASVYAGEINADNSIAAYKNAGNQATIRVIAASYGNASEANLDLANFASKNLNLRSGFRLSAGVGAGGENTNEYLSLSAISLLSNGTISSTERLRINSAGQFGVGLIPTARNNTILQIVDGIGFPATQVPSSDPNTLDDYEEGSFTPVAKGQSSAGVGTYTIQLGKYTKVGRVVFFQILITWTAHTGTGNLQITGLPFITASDPYSYSYFTVAPSDLTYSGQMAANAQPGTDIVSILSLSSNSPITPIGMDTSAGLRITGHYLV